MDSIKSSLRAQVRALKRQHTSEELSAMSAEICRNICSDGLWRTAGTVLLYHPLSDEVDVRPLIDEAVKLGHTVVLPVVIGPELELRLYEGEESLNIGSYGIMEPDGPLFPPERYHEINLAIIPGMAFDHSRHRLGRGKGYYDRLLPHLSSAHLIGVCFPFQMLPSVPINPHDIDMDETVTGQR